jgi:hypothetical protein
VKSSIYFSGSIVVLVASLAQAQVPVPLGDEFQVHTYTDSIFSDHQRSPSVATDATGRFVVVWEYRHGDGSDYGVFGQSFLSDGARAGSEFQVNTATHYAQYRSEVARSKSGNFVVVWKNRLGIGLISAQRYDGEGNALGSQIDIGMGNFPSVDIDEMGRFVVTWSDYDQDQYGIFARRFDELGVPLGEAFQVNTTYTRNQTRSDVSVSDDGQFVVVWSQTGYSGSDVASIGIYGQRFDSLGSSLGAELRVNSYLGGRRELPSIAMNQAGEFTVVWCGTGRDDQYGIFGRRFSASAVPLGPEFLVNTYTTYAQWWPKIAMDGKGQFVVVWTSADQDHSHYSIFGQVFDRTGTKQGTEFPVNVLTGEAQRFPSVAMDESGRFVVVWQEEDTNQVKNGIYGRRFLIPKSVSTSHSISVVVLFLFLASISIYFRRRWSRTQP